MLKKLFASMALCGALIGTAPTYADYVHPFAYPQPESGGDFFALIEIPAGSITKYEVDEDTGHVFVDRYMSMPVVYPANYGSIPSSQGGDGDPLDVLVFTREPILPGALIKVRAIGILHMVDGGEQDDKIVAVPAGDIDPTYDAIRTIDDLPAIERERLESFFRVYKQLPEGGKVVELGGFSGENTAIDMVQEAIDAGRAPAD